MATLNVDISEANMYTAILAVTENHGRESNSMVASEGGGVKESGGDGGPFSALCAALLILSFRYDSMYTCHSLSETSFSWSRVVDGFERMDSSTVPREAMHASENV